MRLMSALTLGASLFAYRASATNTIIPPTAAIGTGSNHVDLFISGDVPFGPADFTLSLDGVSLGAHWTDAPHDLKEDRLFVVSSPSFTPSTSHTIAITFTNDQYNATTGEDENLYLDEATYNSVFAAVLSGSSIALYSDGTGSFTFTIPGTAAGGTTTGTSPTGAKLKYVGVNEGAGPNAPQDCPGTAGTNWIFPAASDATAAAAYKSNFTRVGFLACRVTNDPGGDLNTGTLAALDAYITAATALGITVDVEDHDYGDWYGVAILPGSAQEAEYDAMWANFANRYKGNPLVWLGPMNEPNTQTPAQWALVAAKVVATIRGTGATNKILISGTNWDGAESWDAVSSVDGSSNAVSMLTVTDPDKNMDYEIHSYPDASGGGVACDTSTSTGVARMQAVTAWAATNHETLFLGETGGCANTALDVTAVENELTYAQQNSAEWDGFAVWITGPWQNGNIYYVGPTATGVESLMQTMLSQFAP
jgi:endoglucanase